MSRFLIGSMVLAFIADMVLNFVLWLGGLDTVVSVSSGALEIFARIMSEVLVIWSLHHQHISNLARSVPTG
ncbi:hypothetical protein ACCT25_09415, partial [Rhizobium ruizarguesonis]